MCLLALAWDPAAPRRVVLVGNRDEFHDRPTAPLDWWGAPPLLGGRDLTAGGTWLGVDARGRFGAITNFRGASVPAGAPSRGALIPRFLAGEARPLEFLGSVARDAGRYAGFSLLVGDARELGYLCNQESGGPRLLGAGVYGLSNASLDAPWPKLVVSRNALAARLAAPLTDAATLLDLLADRGEAADGELPDTGVGLDSERRLSAAFVVGPAYGTRSTTAVLLAADGSGEVAERSYAADGRATGTRLLRIAGAR